MTVLEMTRREFSRLEIVVAIEDGSLSVNDAAMHLRLSRRQVFRLLDRFRSIGPSGLASRKRGAPSNNRIHRSTRQFVMMLVRQHYADFGPTLACEKLREVHDCHVSRETLRKWMMEDGLWLDRRRRLPSVHQPRNRRERVGELIQIDGSTHHWFENRGGKCTLLAFIDDATSRLQHAAFVPSESAFDYMRETRRYIERYGRPIAFYSDKHAIFRINNPEAIGGTGMTQFGRALHEINVDIICANSAPAKGRIERCFGTLQDRLVKELRLAEISKKDNSLTDCAEIPRCPRHPRNPIIESEDHDRFSISSLCHALPSPDCPVTGGENSGAALHSRHVDCL